MGDLKKNKLSKSDMKYKFRLILIPQYIGNSKAIKKSVSKLNKDNFIGNARRLRQFSQPC
jgi:hypothetical protein